MLIENMNAVIYFGLCIESFERNDNIYNEFRWDLSYQEVYIYY